MASAGHPIGFGKIDRWTLFRDVTAPGLVTTAIFFGDDARLDGVTLRFLEVEGGVLGVIGDTRSISESFVGVAGDAMSGEETDLVMAVASRKMNRV